MAKHDKLKKRVDFLESLWGRIACLEEKLEFGGPVDKKIWALEHLVRRIEELEKIVMSRDEWGGSLVRRRLARIEIALERNIPWETLGHLTNDKTEDQSEGTQS